MGPTWREPGLVAVVTLGKQPPCTRARALWKAEKGRHLAQRAALAWEAGRRQEAPRSLLSTTALRTGRLPRRSEPPGVGRGGPEPRGGQDPPCVPSSARWRGAGARSAARDLALIRPGRALNGAQRREDWGGAAGTAEEAQGCGDRGTLCRPWGGPHCWCVEGVLWGVVQASVGRPVCGVGGWWMPGSRGLRGRHLEGPVWAQWALTPHPHTQSQPFRPRLAPSSHLICSPSVPWSP